MAISSLPYALRRQYADILQDIGSRRASEKNRFIQNLETSGTGSSGLVSQGLRGINMSNAAQENKAINQILLSQLGQDQARQSAGLQNVYALNRMNRQADLQSKAAEQQFGYNKDLAALQNKYMLDRMNKELDLKKDWHKFLNPEPTFWGIAGKGLGSLANGFLGGFSGAAGQALGNKIFK